MINCGPAAHEPENMDMFYNKWGSFLLGYIKDDLTVFACEVHTVTHNTYNTSVDCEHTFIL